MKQLQKLINQGIVKLDTSIPHDNTYLGKATDGVWVQLGKEGDEKQIEEYLKKRPTPDKW